jgi:SNF2 family DNA or RNA helicase
MKKRQAEVDRFQNGDAQVFLISLKAGGVGLNLTAASYIFLMDPWWNPAVENQAIDRAYRIGQENKLTVYRPIIKDSVEEKVLVLQNTKKELFKDLMSNDDQNFFSGKLSLDDFQQLIN